MNEWYDAEQRVERAEELFEQRKRSESREELRAAVSINPYNSAWLYNMGLTLDEMERYDEAIQAYTQALAVDADEVETLCRLGEDQFRTSRFEPALRTFERVEQLEPGRESCYCERIGIYCEMGEHEKAEEMFYLARLYKEHCPRCYYNIGCSLAARSMYDKAIHCWQQSLSLEESNPQAHVRIAEALWSKDLLEEARRHYLAAMRQDPGNVEIILDLGDLLSELGRSREADEKYRRAIELVPEDPAGHFCHGKWLAEYGGPRAVRAAAACFRRALQLDPTWPESHLQMAHLYARRRDKTRALRELRAEWRLNPDEPGTLLDLGMLLMDLEQWPLAGEVFKRLVEIDPENQAGQLNRAIVCFELEQHDLGVAACRIALRRHPRNLTAIYNLAVEYERRGQYHHALFWVRRGLQSDSVEPDLLRLRFRVLAMMAWNRVRGFLGFARKYASPNNVIAE
jgi:tetratricopeptide (TPR) repeat protein